MVPPRPGGQGARRVAINHPSTPRVPKPLRSASVMKWTKVFVLAAGPVVLLASASLLAVAQDDKAPTIKQVMGKLHKGAKAPIAQLKTQLSAPSPNWESIQKTTKDFVILGAALAKNDPP